jgi:hypothetical protein
MPDARVVWFGDAAQTGDNQADLTVPDQLVSDYAFLLWGCGGHNAIAGFGRFSRFVDDGATNWGHTEELVMADWPHTPTGAYGIWYLANCGAGLRQGGTLSVNWGGAPGSIDLHIIAAIVDPGVPVELRAAGDQTGTVSETTMTINLPGTRGFGRELELMLVAGKSASANLGTLPGTWEEDGEASDPTAVVHAWFVEHLPGQGSRDIEGGRSVDFPWASGANPTHWAAGTVIMTELIEVTDRIPCGFTDAVWDAADGAALDATLQQVSLPAAGVAPWPYAQTTAGYNLQSVVTPAEERDIRTLVFFPEWPTLGAGDLLRFSVGRFMIGSTDATVRMQWDGGTDIDVEEVTPYGLLIARGTIPFVHDRRWWMIRSAVNAGGTIWETHVAASYDGVGLSAVLGWDAQGLVSNTGSESAKWLVDAKPRVELIKSAGGSGTARTAYFNGCGPALGPLCEDFEDELTHDDVFTFFGSSASATGGDLVVASGQLQTQLGDVVGYPLPLGFEIEAWPVPDAGFPNSWSVEMFVDTAVVPGTTAKSQGSADQLYTLDVFVDANEITVDAWGGPGFTTNLGSFTGGAPDKASLRFWLLRRTAGGLVVETAPTGSGPWTTRLDLPGWLPNPDGYQMSISGRAFNGTTFDGGGFSVERIGCFPTGRQRVWVSLVGV